MIMLVAVVHLEVKALRRAVDEPIHEQAGRVVWDCRADDSKVVVLLGQFSWSSAMHSAVSTHAVAVWMYPGSPSTVNTTFTTVPLVPVPTPTTSMYISSISLMVGLRYHPIMIIIPIAVRLNATLPVMESNAYPSMYSTSFPYPSMVLSLFIQQQLTPTMKKGVKNAQISGRLDFVINFQ